MICLNTYPYLLNLLKRLLLLVSLFGAKVVMAQSPHIDSLKAQLDAHPQADTGRVNRLNALGRAVDGSNPVLALRLTEEARQLAERLHYGPGLAQAYMNLAWHYTTVNDCPRALGYAQQARRQYLALGDRIGHINSLTQLAYINIARGSYVQSINYAQQALVLVEPLPDKSKKAYVNLLLGQLHAHLGNYDQARTYARAGLGLAREVHDRGEISRGLNILGEIHRMQGQWAAALGYYQQDLGQYKTPSINKAVCEGNIADVSEQLGRFDEAFAYGERVWNYCRLIRATSYVAWIEGVLARAYLHTGQLDKATAYGTRSLTVAEQGGLQKIASDAAQVLAEAYARQKNYAAAFRYQSRFLSLKDSLGGEETIRQTAALQYKLDLDKKQSQIALLTKNREIEQQRSQYQYRLLIAVGIGLLLVVALSVVLFRNVQVKQRINRLLYEQKQMMETTLTEKILLQRQQLLESQLKAHREELRVAQAQLRLQQEKERIARDLHDHVGAQLSVIATSLDHLRLTYPANSPAMPLEDIGSYAREAIGSLRETIWAINTEQVSLDELQLQVQQYLARQQTLVPAIRFRLLADGLPAAYPPVQLSSEQALNLFRIIQEAVQNAVKHAHADQISVRMAMDAAGALRLSVEDDGLGFDLNTDHPGHYGLLNMQLRAERLGGSWRVSSVPGQGTTLSLDMQQETVPDITEVRLNNPVAVGGV